MKKSAISFLAWSGCLALVAGFAMLGLGTPEVQSRKDVTISRGFAETVGMLPIVFLLYAGLALLPVYYWHKRRRAAELKQELVVRESKIRQILAQTPRSRD